MEHSLSSRVSLWITLKLDSNQDTFLLNFIPALSGFCYFLSPTSEAKGNSLAGIHANGFP